MPAKKVIPTEAPKTCGGTMKWICGVITILLGIAIWPSVGWLGLEQFFAIIFILLGVMKIFGCHHHC